MWTGHTDRTIRKYILKDRLMTGESGFPMTSAHLRLLVKNYRDASKCIKRMFKSNLPGMNSEYYCLARHKGDISKRFAENHKRGKVAVSAAEIYNYFDNLERIVMR